ncbi:DUF3653 domain-containing protein [Dokdonella soli]|uniref:Uncharacterized protein n=1 Tax=Dokdonella soli TaxID=529810 RepID=A0ABN1ICT6_9GAMM
MDLCPPFDGWTLDTDGILHTPSGYRCTPDQIEAALWLVGMLRFDHAKRPIFADSMIEPQRPLYEARDWIGEDLNRLQIIARRGRCLHCERQERG